jgi:hypothetical protein
VVRERHRSTGQLVALVGGLACFLAVGLGAVVSQTVKIRTPHGTVTWDCGSRVHAKHYTVAQTSQMLDEVPLTFANGRVSASQAAAVDKSELDASCSLALGQEWTLGAVLVGLAGLILVGVGLARVRWPWLVIPAVIAIGLTAWGSLALFPIA